jgi:hypothetical protein
VLEAELAYSTVTENNLLREAVFMGLREDREASPAHPRARTSPRSVSDRPKSGLPRENVLLLLPEAVTQGVLSEVLETSPPASRAQAAQARASRQSHGILSQRTAAAGPRDRAQAHD